VRRPGAVLFDLDDTLYPERAFVDSGFRAVGRFLAPHLDRSAGTIARRLRALHARDGRGRLFDMLLAESGRPADPDLVLAAVLVYRSHRPRLTPFAGVVETLDRIRDGGIATGLVSDGLSAVQRRKLAALTAVARRLDVVVMTDELGPGCAKPSPVPFRVACRILGVDSGRAVYVANDPRKDFAGARAAGLATIRTGLLPDEGGTATRAMRDDVDADVVIDRFAGIADELFRAAPSASGVREGSGA
jgi:putative hydrolase of the HAD superfamily